MRLTRLGAIAVLTLAASTPVLAGPDTGRPLGPPLILRLDGVVASGREEAARIGFTTASFGVLGGAPDTRVWLGVDDARTVGGDNAVNGKDVLESLAGYQPTFLLAGPKPLVAQVTSLGVGVRVRLEGLVGRRARTFLVRAVSTDAGP
ncbi:MAG: hypothetical protein KIT14_18040 [bacterium]|nr:hypothetical protein [bacterium]